MKGLMPLVLGAGAGAVSTALVPALLGKVVPSLSSGYMTIAVEGVSAVAGYKIFGGKFGLGWLAGGLAKVIYDLAAGPIMSLLTPTTVTTAAAATAGYGDMGMLAAPVPGMGDAANPYGENIF